MRLAQSKPRQLFSPSTTSPAPSRRSPPETDATPFPPMHLAALGLASPGAQSAQVAPVQESRPLTRATYSPRVPSVCACANAAAVPYPQRCLHRLSPPEKTVVG